MVSIPGEDTGKVPVAAILIFMCALCLAASNGALMKYLTGSIPVVTIIWARYTINLLIMLPIALYYFGTATFRPPNLPLQLLRIGFMLFGTSCFLTGVADMVYADAIAILYVYPFVIIVLSPFFLSERVSIAAWLCVATGFVGVLIVMRPSFDSTGLPALFILVAGIVLGCHLVMARFLVRSRSPLITAAFTALVIAAATSLVVPFIWQPISSHEFLLIIAMGVVTAASQYLMLLAFSQAQAPLLAPFGYTEIPAAAAIGMVVFGEFPDIVAWGGIALIIVSGVAVAKLSSPALQPSRPRQPLP